MRRGKINELVFLVRETLRNSHNLSVYLNRDAVWNAPVMQLGHFPGVRH
jgi:hypothetical protein